MKTIKQVYSQVESDKANSIKSKDYTMPLDDFIEEHENLIEVLRTGSREELLAEADKQEEQLNECLKENGMESEEGPNESEDGEDDMGD